MKDGEAWLAALARTAREQDLTADPRWDALAERELSADDEVELRAQAGRSTAARAALEAFRPFDESERDAFEAQVMTAMEATPAATSGAAPTAAVPSLSPAAAQVATSAASTAPQPKTVIAPLRARRRALVAMASTGLLATAAAALLLFRPAAGPPFPGYTLSIAGGERNARGAPGAPAAPRIGPGSLVELVLRPATPVRGPVAVRGVLVQGGRRETWRPPVEITADGVVRIAGTREALFPGLPDGPWEVVLAVGRPDALPADPAAAQGAPEDLQVLRATVVLKEEPARAP
ncbi:hypothetical protein [Sorangium sp. So ce385]|uniref:hypothetical protein n=1 Tax=Sorangium sp. So ce385 TaxID=3133308 RepID=UPI003F5BAC8F